MRITNMADIRLKTVTVDSGPSGVSGPLYIKSGSVSLLDTSVSSSFIDGSFVTNGGISINCTYNSNSSTSGGALTIGGGVGISKNVNLGQNLKLENSIGVLEVAGLSTPRFYLDSVVNKTCSISPDGVNSRFILNDTSLKLTSTQTSINGSSGSLVVSGGLTIMATDNSSSSSVGGSVTIAGGVGISKDVNIGSKMLVGPNDSQIVVGSTIDPTNSGMFINYLSNLNAGIISGQTNKNILLSPYSGNVGIRTTSPSYTLDVRGTVGGNTFTGENVYLSQNLIATEIFSTFGNFVVSTISNLNSSWSTIGNITATNITTNNLLTDNGKITNFTSENIKITDSNIDNILNTNITSNNLINVNFSNTNITTLNVLATNITSNGLYISTGNVLHNIVTNSTTTNLINTNLTSNNAIISNFTGTNSTFTNLVNNNITCGSSVITNVLTINGNLNGLNNSNTLGSILTTGGNVGIGKIPNYKLDVSGNSSFGVNSNTFLQLDFSNNTAFPAGNFATSGTILIQGYDNGVLGGVYRPVTIHGDIINLSTGYNTYNTRMHITSSGNVGIGTTSPGSLLSVNGSGSITTLSSTNITTTNISAATVIGNAGSAEAGNFSNTGVGNTTVIINPRSTSFTNTALFVTSTRSSNSVFNLITANASSTNMFNVRGDGQIFMRGAVGINTTNPSYTLDVNGTIRSTGHPNIIGSIVTSAGSLSIGTGEPPNVSFRIGMPVESAIGTIGPDRLYINFTGFDLDIRSDPIGSVLYCSKTDRVVTLNGTKDSTSINDGCLVVSGGVGIGKNLNVSGNIKLYSTEDSSSISTGSFVLAGGMGIAKNLYIGGNTTITGNLIVGGTTTSVDVSTTILNDNIMILNAGPAGSRDSGFIINRFQEDNNTGSGDVVNDLYPIILRIGDQTGMNSVQIKLPSGASSSNDYYKNWWIRITSGFSSNQVRKIIAYNGSTKIATVSSAWNSQNPANNDYVSLYNRGYVGLIYDETNDIFVFGSTTEDPGDANINFTDRMPVQFSRCIGVSTEASTNLSSGCMVLSGGITINSTEDSASLTNGGTITTAGGMSVGKTLRAKELYINGIHFTPNTGDILTTQVFSANNDQTWFSDITGLVFDNSILGVDIYLSVKITASVNLAANFHIRGINKGTSWEIVKTYVGDDTGIEFNMTNSGQLQYTTQNYSGATQIQFKFKAFTN